MKRSALHAVGWSGLEAASAAGLSLASALFLARVIGPAELGTGAAAVSVHVLLWIGVNALFGDALVQRSTLDDITCATALWTSVGIGCLAAAIQMGAGFVLAAAFADPRLVPMSLCLALPLPLVGAAGVVQGRLTRERGYGRLAGRTILGQGLGTATGITAAIHGAGAWATVDQQVVTSAVGALALVAGANWRPMLVWRWHSLREVLAVGLPLTASTLVLHARYRLFAILIGGSAGPYVLGQVHIAFRLTDTVRELSFTALWRLMLPALSERQGSRTALLAGVDRLLGLSAMAMLPLCALMLLTLRPVVTLLLGPGWAVAGHAAEPLIALMVMQIVTFPAGVALVAAGQARFTLYANLASLGLIVAGVLLVGPTDPLQAVLLWCVSQALVMPYAMWVNARALGVGPLRPLRAALPMAAVSAVAAAIAMLLPDAATASLPAEQWVVLRVLVWLSVVSAGVWLVQRRGLPLLAPVLAPVAKE